MRLKGLANWHLICREYDFMTTNLIRAKSEILEEAQQKLDKVLDASEDKHKILFMSGGRMASDIILQSYIDDINPKKYDLGKIEIVVGTTRFLAEMEEED
jgi:hypothetical protein